MISKISFEYLPDTQYAELVVYVGDLYFGCFCVPLVNFEVAEIATNVFRAQFTGVNFGTFPISRQVYTSLNLQISEIKSRFKLSTKTADNSK